MLTPGAPPTLAPVQSRRGSPRDRSAHLGGNGGFANSLGKGLLDSAPGEHGAFDALREFTDALEELEVAERS
jgi:hypothetical protein